MARAGSGKLLQAKKVYYLINISQHKKKSVILGLGQKFNSLELSEEDQEYVFFLSRFAMIALDNAQYLNRRLKRRGWSMSCRSPATSSSRSFPSGSPGSTTTISASSISPFRMSARLLRYPAEEKTFYRWCWPMSKAKDFLPPCWPPRPGNFSDSQRALTCSARENSSRRPTR